ncbi:MAG: TIM barrel protein [Planctomycetes bacterium]|nr:TIM barrel protein [Planctomycetota bacterium]
MGEIRLSCYTAPWGDAGLVQAITEISECGFDGIECPASLVNEYEDRLHVFEEILEKSRLTLAGLVQNVDLLDREHADEQVEKAVNSARFVSAASQGTLTIRHIGEVPEDISDEMWATVGAILEEIADRCSYFNTKVCFLPTADGPVSSEKDISRLMAMTNEQAVGLSLDTSEIALAGGSPQRVIKTHIDRLCMVRYRDVSGSKRKAKSGAPAPTPTFGRGAVNFEAVSKNLLSGGYSGWVTLDITGEQHTPLDAISNGSRFMMRKSGLFPI